MPPGRLAAPLVSMVFTEPPPPLPSMMRMIGRRKSCSISSAIKGFAEMDASAEPPRTVKSSPTTTTVRPSTLPRPNTQLAGVRCLSSPRSSYSPIPETAPISWNVSASTILSMRSRTVSRSWSRCRLTFSTPPISRANASRRASSSSSGFQIIRLLRLGDIVVGPDRDRLPLEPVVEEIALSAFEQAADRITELDHRRRDIAVQPLLVVHRREEPDRHHDERLILWRPNRHRETVDVRAPQAAGDDITLLAQQASIVLDPRPQQLAPLRYLALHLRDQRIAHGWFERCGVGVARRRRGDRNAAAGRFMQAKRVGGAGIFEIDEVEAVGNEEADGARQLFGDLLQPQADEVAQLQTLHHGGAHRHRARTNPVFLVTRQIDELAHPRQRMGEPRHRRARQAAANGNLEIAEPGFVALEASEHVERARHHLNDITAFARPIRREHSLSAQAFRASSHDPHPFRTAE